MKKLFLPLLLTICLVFVSGCGTNKTEEYMEKHVVHITKDNYEKYITIETNLVVDSVVTYNYHYFRGALSYAFYDNVIITYDFLTSSNKTEKTLSLNAGGCGTIKTFGSRQGSSNYEITNVSGTIIYWI